MVCKNTVDELAVLTQSLHEFTADFRMVCLALRFGALSDVMQESRTHCERAVRTDFRCYHAGKDCDFLRVEKHVLTVACPEVEPSQCPYEFGTHVVDAEIEDNLLTLVHDYASDFLRDLVDDFLDSCRMNSSILHKTLECDSCNFLPDRVET